MRTASLDLNEIYHVYNRGTMKMNIFTSPDDYNRFKQKMYEYKIKYEVTIYAYCLMPNHFHLILSPRSRNSNVSKFMKLLQNSHAQYFNKKYGKSGHLMQGAFQYKRVIDDAQMLTLVPYVLNNPVRKGLAPTPSAWPYLAICNHEALHQLDIPKSLLDSATVE